jgi:peptide deformylase
VAVLDIVTFPDARLHQPSRLVEKFDDELRSFIEDMLETMYDAGGIGLAAVQVGKNVQVLVIDPYWGSSGKCAPLVMINPVIEESSHNISLTEGCLSVPDSSISVTRASAYKIKYRTADGNTTRIQLEDLEENPYGFARVFGHEYDHLLGRVIMDYAPIDQLNELS